MREPTAATLRLRDAIEQHRSNLDEVLDRYGATNPRLFGSMAYDAVLRNLALIGEAVKSLPDDFKQRRAATP